MSWLTSRAAAICSAEPGTIMMMNEGEQHGQVAVAGSAQHAGEDNGEAERQDVGHDHGHAKPGGATGVGAAEIADSLPQGRGSGA